MDDGQAVPHQGIEQGHDARHKEGGADGLGQVCRAGHGQSFLGAIGNLCPCLGATRLPDDYLQAQRWGLNVGGIQSKPAPHEKTAVPPRQSACPGMLCVVKRLPWMHQRDQQRVNSRSKMW